MIRIVLCVRLLFSCLHQAAWILALQGPIHLLRQEIAKIVLTPVLAALAQLFALTVFQTIISSATDASLNAL